MIYFIYNFFFLISINSLMNVYGFTLNNKNTSEINNIKKERSMIVKEVPYGDTVTLLCRSNDEDHIFNYWYINGRDTIVGPGNDFNDFKYKYEVLSGNLTIKGVTLDEEGTYNCVSKGIRQNDINIRSIRMIVSKDWEEVYEHDSTVNIIRIVAAGATLSILSGAGYIFYTMWKNRLRKPSYLMQSDDEEEEDDSGEEIFRAPGTSTNGENIVRSVPITDNFDSPLISTDFNSILDSVNNK